MFTWICPQCGREVPPAYNDCPNCHPEAQPSGAGQQPPAQPLSTPPPPPAQAPAPPAPQPQYPSYAPPPPPPLPPAPEPPAKAAEPALGAESASVLPSFSFSAGTPPPKRSGLPTWLMAIIFAGGILVIVGGLYWLLGSKSANSAAALSQPSANELHSAPAPGGTQHPLQKFMEISGIRFQEDPHKKKVIMVTFLVTNHSDSDAPGLAGNVSLWSNTRRSDEDNVGHFSFSADLKPDSSKELTVPLTTTKALVELPDWQYLNADLQITAPPFSGGSLQQK